MDDRRKRLLFRTAHMGMKETDALLGRFAKAHVADLNDEQLDQFENLMTQADADLFDWIIERRPAPKTFQGALLTMIVDFNKK